MGGACGTYGRQETMEHGFGGENPKEREHLQDLAIDASIILKWILQTLVWRSWTGSIWLSIRVSGMLLLTRQ